MKGTPAEEATRWLRQSEMDLDDAQFMAEGKRYNLACFLAQQAAEKALRAFIYKRGAEAIWGHSVAELCRDATKLDGGFADLMSHAAPLDKYYVPTRYPNGLPGGIPSEAFAVQDADLALSMAARVLQFVKERL